MGGKPLLPRLDEPMEGRVNFFIGSQENWRTNIPVYRKLAYDDVWPGIDVEYLGYMDRLEYRLIVHPGADPAAAVMATGAETLALDEAGNLTAKLEGASLRMSRPRAWQERDGQKIPVEARFRPLLGPAGRYGFDLGTFDPALGLVIDPILSWSTYLGTDGLEDYLGASQDLGYGIAVDSSGNAYVTGATSSSSFPVTVGAFDTLANGSSDIFVAKLNAAGSALVFSTYLGGTDEECGYGITVDATGNAYVTGYTHSSDFPSTVGAYDTTFNGSVDAFITKLNMTGSALVYSTFLGGTSADCANDIARDTAGNIYVTGFTESSDFPATPGAFDQSLNSARDSFIAKLNVTGSALDYATFLGGSGSAGGSGIAVDSSGNAYITGYAGVNFPVTPGAFDTSYNALDVPAPDAFITKVNAAGTALIYSTYLGGEYNDGGLAIAVDASGNAYVAGYNLSSPGGSDFPTTEGAYDRSHNGEQDLFITKLNVAGSALVFSTFIGGAGNDFPHDIEVDASGFAYVTGSTTSSNFPVTTGAFDTTSNGGGDVFITKLNATGSTLVYSTFLGGSNAETGYGIALAGTQTSTSRERPNRFSLQRRKHSTRFTRAALMHSSPS